MHTSNKSAMLPRLMAVTCVALMVATFAIGSVDDPSIVKVMKIEKRLNHTAARVTENSEQIQQILATKYKLEPAEPTKQ